jgi:phosphate transport system protein
MANDHFRQPGRRPMMIGKPWRNRSTAMREHFHHELDELVVRLTDQLDRVQTALARATDALLDADVALADDVIAEEAALESACLALDDHALTLLARQQPVATDLRTIVAALQINSDLQRMGRLASHVAEVARDTRRRAAVPADLRIVIRLMSETGARIAAGAGAAIAARDVDAAARLERADDELDRLRDGLYRRLFDGSWEHGVDTAVQVALIGRYYERYADHAVALARHVAFLAGRIGIDQDTPA